MQCFCSWPSLGVKQATVYYFLKDLTDLSTINILIRDTNRACEEKMHDNVII